MLLQEGLPTGLWVSQCEARPHGVPGTALLKTDHPFPLLACSCPAPMREQAPWPNVPSPSLASHGSGQTRLWPPVCWGGPSIQVASSCRLAWNRMVGVSPSIPGRRKPACADGTLCVLSSWSGKCLCCSLHSLAAGHSGQPVGDFPPAQHLVDQVLALLFSAVTIKPPTSLQCAPLPSHRYLGSGSEEGPPS